MLLWFMAKNAKNTKWRWWWKCTHKGSLKVHLWTNFGWNPIRIYGVKKDYLVEGLSCLQGKLFAGISWNLACRWNNHHRSAFLSLEMNQGKDHWDMKPNPNQCQNYVNKNSISLYMYQAKCLKNWIENRSVVGIVIIESPSCSIEESEWNSELWSEIQVCVSSARSRYSNITVTFRTLLYSKSYLLKNSQAVKMWCSLKKPGWKKLGNQRSRPRMAAMMLIVINFNSNCCGIIVKVY